MCWRPSAISATQDSCAKLTLAGIILVRFFLDKVGTRGEVDLLLQLGAAIVGDVNGAGKFNETVAKTAGGLFGADIVLDVPELGIHPAQPVCQLHQLVAVEHPATDKRTQGLQLGRHILQLGLVADPLRLDLEDGDLVDDLTD